MSPAQQPDVSGRTRWFRRIGPGLVTACVVIGPGSLLASSKVGAVHGTTIGWLPLLAIACLVVYTTLAARLGVVAHGSPGTLVTARAGRWLAVTIGLAVFFVAATFQFANNLGVSAALEIFGMSPRARIVSVVLFNVLSLVFLFGLKNVYAVFERLMTVFVGVMLLAFAVNLLRIGPDPFALLAGLVPTPGRIAEVRDAFRSEVVPVELLALVATTFSAAAAYYQAYAVRHRGWQRDDLRDGLLDARVSGVVMGAITLMLVWTAATVLYGNASRDEVESANVVAIASQLKPAFGVFGTVVFGVGLLSAAYSSFLVNSMIGGCVLADGLGLDDQPSSHVTRGLTALVMLIGLGVAVVIVRLEIKPVGAIVAAQAVTVLVSPLMAGVLLWLTNRRDVMGDERNGTGTNVVAGLALVVLVLTAVLAAVHRVAPAFHNWWFGGG